MLKNKYFILALLLSICTSASAITLDDIDFPKPPAYRVGISAVPENQYIQVKENFDDIEKISGRIESSNDDNATDLSYADLSIKRLSKEVSRELVYEERDMVSDLTLLWQGAATQSDTINFALYKLANPDIDKPDKQSLKKVLSTIASMSTLVGASMASPVFAGSSLIGSNILGIMSQDTKALNYKYTKVNDADMIILIRKVEDLQQNAVDLYYDYMSARKQVEMISQLVEQRQKKFNLAQSNNASRELIVITDAYYRSALDKQRTARSNFLSKRAALEQFVGNEAFTQFENELIEREKKEHETNSSEVANPQNQNVAYSQPSYEADNDPYVNMLPDLPPLEVESQAKTPETIENQASTEPELKVKSKKKEDKYSTKELIFLHGKTKQEAKSPNTAVSNTYQQTKTPAQKLNTDFNLLPLDEIVAPRNGHSIYDELEY
ncbi:hypothetical protein IJ579_03770 [bacterium]|nr:hypothetical protein [bacterium]